MVTSLVLSTYASIVILFGIDGAPYPPTANARPQGKEYVFISNVDNLGATVDLKLLYHVVDSEADFALEVVNSTRADNEGGLLVG
jgi:UTP--glucose-1-phosphate uridylyltransferase